MTTWRIKGVHAFFRDGKISRFRTRFLQLPEHVADSCGALRGEFCGESSARDRGDEKSRVHGVADDLVGITLEIEAASFFPQSVL
jgi:hypothetical protein